MLHSLACLLAARLHCSISWHSLTHLLTTCSHLVAHVVTRARVHALTNAHSCSFTAPLTRTRLASLTLVVLPALAVGATPFYDPGWADDGTGLDVVVEPWKENLWPALTAAMKESGMMEGSTQRGATSESNGSVGGVDAATGECHARTLAEFKEKCVAMVMGATCTAALSGVLEEQLRLLQTSAFRDDNNNVGNNDNTRDGVSAAKATKRGASGKDSTRTEGSVKDSSGGEEGGAAKPAVSSAAAGSPSKSLRTKGGESQAKSTSAKSSHFHGVAVKDFKLPKLQPEYLQVVYDVVPSEGAVGTASPCVAVTPPAPCVASYKTAVLCARKRLTAPEAVKDTIRCPHPPTHPPTHPRALVCVHPLSRTHTHTPALTITRPHSPTPTLIHTHPHSHTHIPPPLPPPSPPPSPV
jgi:hypothetical protein